MKFPLEIPEFSLKKKKNNEIPTILFMKTRGKIQEISWKKTKLNFLFDFFCFMKFHVEEIPEIYETEIKKQKLKKKSVHVFPDGIYMGKN